MTNVVDSKLSDGGEEFDGFAELGFPSEAAMIAEFTGKPERAKVIAADNDKFIGSMQAWVGVEHPQK